MHSATAQFFQSLLKQGRMIALECLDERLILFDAPVNRLAVIVVVRHCRVDGGEWQVIRSGDLFDSISEAAVQDHNVRDRDARVGNPWFAAARIGCDRSVSVEQYIHVSILLHHFTL